MSRTPFHDPGVEAVFKGYAKPVRTQLLDLRELIFATAAKAVIGEITETLKWGQPAYLPVRPRVGTTIRIDAVKGDAERYAAFFHCQTTLISTFREIYRDAFAFEGNRAIVFSVSQRPDTEALAQCILMALTYHRARQPGVTAK